MFCTKCGFELQEDAVFCSNCGQKIKEHEEPSVVKVQKNNTKKKKIIIICALTAIIFSIIFAILITPYIDFYFLFSLIALSSMILIPIFLIISIITVIRKKQTYKWLIAMGIAMTIFIICLCIPICNHQWSEATCTKPKSCTLCGETDGEPNEQHNWVNATCQKPQECINCGRIIGEPLEHQWQEATCTTPRTCLDCGTIEGSTIEHIEGDWETLEKGLKELYCAVCGEVLDRKVGFAESIYTADDIPDELMNDKFKNAISLFSKGFSKSGLNITKATTYDNGETYIFYLDNLEFLGDECEDGYFQPRIIYSEDAINNDGTPNKLFLEFANPLKSNGYEETVEIVEGIADALDISDTGLIDNDYSSISKLAIGKYATFTFPNLNIALTVSNTDGTVEIEIVPIE